MNRSSLGERSGNLSHPLAQVPLFNGVSCDVLARAVGLAHVKHLHAGVFFFTQGGESAEFFVLTEGRVKLTQIAPEGHQVLLRLIGPGEAFGGAGAVGELLYPTTAEAVEPSSALTWSSAAMRNLLQTEPVIAWNATRLVSGQLYDLQRRFRQVITERVERRVARALLRLARDAGRRLDEGIEIDFAVSRQDIAEMSGTSLFTVSRLLSGWERRGLLSGGRQHIVLTDLKGLHDIAEDEPMG